MVVNYESAIPVRQCGGCTMCCKLFKIEEFEKPADVWCPHCDKGKGCKIYRKENYPKSCGEFQCLWKFEIGEMKDRPDKSKVVLYTGPLPEGVLQLQVHVDVGRPDAWRKGNIAIAIQGFIRLGYRVMIICGLKRTIISPGDTKTQIFFEKLSDKVMDKMLTGRSLKDIAEELKIGF